MGFWLAEAEGKGVGEKIANWYGLSLVTVGIFLKLYSGDDCAYLGLC